MPGSPFKSRPKSDRRQEWRQLKADHATVLKTRNIKVEIGLGKALDGMQKQVDKVVALEAAKLTPTALAPVKTSAAEVKRQATKLGEKVKTIDKLDAFMKALVADADWWITTADGIKNQPAYVDERARGDVDEILKDLGTARKSMGELDQRVPLALKKKTQLYEPPDELEAWAPAAKALKPGLAKVELLSKNKTGNHALLVTALKQMEEPLRTAISKANKIALLKTGGLNDQQTDWEKLKKEASTVTLYLESVLTVIRNMR